MQTPQERIRHHEGKTYIFDAIRKKEVVLTPEEWVRQQIIYHLVTQKKYPPGNLSVEKMIRLGEQQKRYDLLVYHGGTPWLLLECKEETVPLHAGVLQQTLAYLSAMHLAYVALSNGREIQCYHIPSGTWATQFPHYPE